MHHTIGRAIHHCNASLKFIKMNITETQMKWSLLLSKDYAKTQLSIASAIVNLRSAMDYGVRLLSDSERREIESVLMVLGKMETKFGNNVAEDIVLHNLKNQ